MTKSGWNVAAMLQNPSKIAKTTSSFGPSTWQPYPLSKRDTSTIEEKNKDILMLSQTFIPLGQKGRKKRSKKYH